MIRLITFLLGLAVFPAFGASPPSGNNLPVQAVKSGNYTVKSTDLKTVIPMNCSSPCTVTMPQSTSGWPKGYPVQIVNAGSTTVTVHAITSTIYGMPTTGGNVLLTAQGNYVVLNADTTNNYLAYGQTGAGGGGGGSGGCVAMLADSGVAVLSDVGVAICVSTTAPITPTPGVAMLAAASGAILTDTGVALLIQ